MFKRLRLRLILINAIITSIVLFAAFSAIFLVAQNGGHHRPPISSDNLPIFSKDADAFVRERILEERAAAERSLLTSLIIIGFVVEVAVIIVSYYLAELAIRPVRSAYESQKIFIANASHEMKTPLAAISANLEAANLPDNCWISNATREVQTLSELNQSLLLLASSENTNNFQSTPTDIDLKTFIPEILTEFEATRTTKNINFEIFGNYGIISAPEADLRQILKILIDNALKYCSKTVKLTANHHQITIKNDGAKISESDLPHIFERFYQADKSSPGVGLGLAIAQSLAKKNHWQLTVNSNSKFTTFKIIF